MSDTQGTPPKEPVTIKKYANRRLYNTASSSYVTLDHLSQMVKDGTEFLVYDAKTGDDITRSVLTQIIVEEESKGGQTMLPVNFLRQLIGFYGDSLQSLVPRYLEFSMKSFARNQEQMRGYLSSMHDTFGGLFPFGPFEEMGKHNMQMFEQAMNLFSPFRAAAEGEDAGAPKAAGGAGADRDTAIADLESRLADLQRQFAELAKKKGP
ncbi:MAG TPA: polyhydroxyalkanoate synthesis repressor PhaR [Alphaproteobacteria bacterium]|nr:polyhydroxyalkanoate synthesis repressor PhaR [Alphaproteobacteria bacterium]